MMKASRIVLGVRGKLHIDNNLCDWGKRLHRRVTRGDYVTHYYTLYLLRARIRV